MYSYKNANKIDTKILYKLFMLNTIISTFFFTLLLTFSFLILIFPNPVYSLLCLVFIFINSAIMLFINNIEFLALTLIIIYVGALAILFLFIMMMVDIRTSFLLRTDWVTYIIFCSLFFFIFLSCTYYNTFNLFITSSILNFTNTVSWDMLITEINNCQTFGQILYTYYVLFFLIAGLILLIALIGAVVLTHTNILNKNFNILQISKQAKIYLIN